MVVDIIGYEKMDFKGTDGNQIKGCRIYYLEPCNRYGEGQKGNYKFISDVICSEMKVGKAEISVNLSGRISNVKFV